MSDKLVQLQVELKPWKERNFPGQQDWQPLLGIVEELGEIEEAMSRDDAKEVVDGVADAMIFMTNYCIHRGWSIQQIWDSRARNDDLDGLGMVGRLSHHHLKWSQNIRGDAALHERESKKVLGAIMCYLEDVLAPANEDLLSVPDVAFDVWTNVVSKRDWRKKSEATS